MRVTCDTSALTADLKKFKEEVNRKLTNMVSGFAYTVTLAAANNTPVGDEWALVNRPSYRWYYEVREKKYGIDTEVGFHSGAWRYSDKGNYAFDTQIYAQEEAVGRAKQDAKANYKLGQTFYIMASGPGYANLEGGSSPKAPDGIMQPTINEIMSIYLIDLKKYYDAG